MSKRAVIQYLYALRQKTVPVYSHSYAGARPCRTQQRSDAHDHRYAANRRRCARARLASAPRSPSTRCASAKAVANSFAFGATEVGIEAKTFEQEGLEIVATSFRGDAQLQQALAAGGVDIGSAPDPGSASASRARPRSASPACTGRRAILRCCADQFADQDYRDLKGQARRRHHGRSLTDWLVRELSRQQGWGSDGIKILPLGAIQARIAAHGARRARRHRAGGGQRLPSSRSRARPATCCCSAGIVKDFYTHVIFATET